MPAAKIIELADRVRGLLEPTVVNAAGTVIREYVPRHELQDLASLAVTVVPRTAETGRVSRGSLRRDLAIDVAIQKRAKTNAQVDELVRLADDLAGVLWNNTTPVADVTLLSVQVDPVFSPEHLDEKQVFTSVLRATYREGREA